MKLKIIFNSNSILTLSRRSATTKVTLVCDARTWGNPMFARTWGNPMSGAPKMGRQAHLPGPLRLQRAFTLTWNVFTGATSCSQGRRYSKVSDAIPAETALSRNSCVTGAPTTWLFWPFFFVELFTSRRGEGSPLIAQLYPVDGLLFSRITR